MSWVGVVFWGALVVYVLGFIYKYVFMMGEVPLSLLKKEWLISYELFEDLIEWLIDEINL